MRHVGWNAVWADEEEHVAGHLLEHSPSPVPAPAPELVALVSVLFGVAIVKTAAGLEDVSGDGIAWGTELRADTAADRVAAAGGPAPARKSSAMMETPTPMLPLEC